MNEPYRRQEEGMIFGDVDSCQEGSDDSWECFSPYSPWLTLAHSDSFWLILAHPAYFWLTMAHYCPHKIKNYYYCDSLCKIWISLAHAGPLLLFLAHSCSFWLTLAHSGSHSEILAQDRLHNAAVLIVGLFQKRWKAFVLSRPTSTQTTFIIISTPILNWDIAGSFRTQLKVLLLNDQSWQQPENKGVFRSGFRQPEKF